MAFLITACQEYYEPKIDDLSGTLVVESMLTNQKEIFIVKLSRSVAFNKKTRFTGEENAEVFLWSVNGESHQLKESFNQSQKGYYYSIDSIEAKPGQSYYLHIITSKGDEYESEVEEMMPPCGIEAIELKDTFELDINYDSWGLPFINNNEGINISVLPTTPERPDVGFLYQWSSLVNYYVISSDMMHYWVYYCWFKKEAVNLYVYDFFDHESGYSMTLDLLHFFSYNNNLSALPIDSTRFRPLIKEVSTTSFYYYLKQYTITKAGVGFWESLKAQSEASGKLFDPLEEQLPTNIYCRNNSTKKVIGYFNTASYAEKIVLVKIGNNKIYNFKNVEFFPVPVEDENCLLNNKTEFWY